MFGQSRPQMSQLGIKPVDSSNLTMCNHINQPVGVYYNKRPLVQLQPNCEQTINQTSSGIPLAAGGSLSTSVSPFSVRLSHGYGRVDIGKLGESFVSSTSHIKTTHGDLPHIRVTNHFSFPVTLVWYPTNQQYARYAKRGTVVAKIHAATKDETYSVLVEKPFSVGDRIGIFNDSSTLIQEHVVQDPQTRELILGSITVSR